MLLIMSRMDLRKEDGRRRLARRERPLRGSPKVMFLLVRKYRVVPGSAKKKGLGHGLPHSISGQVALGSNCRLQKLGQCVFSGLLGS